MLIPSNVFTKVVVVIVESPITERVLPSHLIAPMLKLLFCMTERTWTASADWGLVAAATHGCVPAAVTVAAVPHELLEPNHVL